jgi:phytoene dehydrogenase-like protein
LSDGTTLRAKAVISSADPTTTFRDLLGYQRLETGTARRAAQYRTRSGTAKLHLALSDLPAFSGLDTAALSQRLVIAPTMDAIESAFNPMKYAECGPKQVFDISIPSIEDSSLAPSGQHVLTALVHYLPYAPKGGWEAHRQAVLDNLIEQLEAYAPGIKGQIVASELLVPPDFEAAYGMTGGNWHHGELSIDQALMMRPFPGSTQYKTTIDGLFLCGAGAHPGGSLMGLPGRNAAKEMIKQGAFA